MTILNKQMVSNYNFLHKLYAVGILQHTKELSIMHFKIKLKMHFKINLNKQIPGKGNFLPCFIFLIRLKNNSSKVRNKTQNTLIKWDTQSSEELVLTRKTAILERSVVFNFKFWNSC